jgi:Holliday junction resolvasome RuvABC endonuclease subunit
MLMRLLAFDQATHLTGWAMLDDSLPEGNQITWGVLRCQPTKGEDIHKRGRRMKRLIKDHLLTSNPDYVSFEGVFLGENPQTVIDLATFRGKCIGMAEDQGFPVILVEIHETMTHLHLKPGVSRKNKKARAQFVATADLFGTVYASDGKKPLLSEDEADAVVLLRITEGKVRLTRLVEAASVAIDYGAEYAD